VCGSARRLDSSPPALPQAAPAVPRTPGGRAPETQALRCCLKRHLRAAADSASGSCRQPSRPLHCPQHTFIASKLSFAPCTSPTCMHKTCGKGFADADPASVGSVSAEAPQLDQDAVAQQATQCTRAGPRRALLNNWPAPTHHRSPGRVGAPPNQLQLQRLRNRVVSEEDSLHDRSAMRRGQMANRRG
jgi:hypothetical protein